MIRQDYLLRLIEEFAQSLRAILQDRARRTPAESRRDIEETVEQRLGLQLDELSNKTEARIIDDLLQSYGPLAGRDVASLVAAAYHARSLTRKAPPAAGQVDPDLLRALRLLLQLSLQFDPADFPAIVPKLESAIQPLTPEDIPADAQLPLAAYFEKTGQGGLALQWTASFLERTPTGPLRNWTAALCERLLRKRPEDLARDDLTREEVEDARTRLLQQERPS